MHQPILIPTAGNIHLLLTNAPDNCSLNTATKLSNEVLEKNSALK
jgi:hypothetical protein